MIKTKAYLALASGRIFQGWAFGSLLDPNLARRESSGEVVFNTSLTGYQEILTDPSYQGQIVAMTPSHIGNYGINDDDSESGRVYLSGFVVQELSPVYSNWRATGSLHDYLLKAGVPGVSGIDTRALTRCLRTLGAVNGILSIDGRDLDRLAERAKALPGLEGQDLTKQVTTAQPYPWAKGTGASQPAGTPRRKVVVMDFGVKQNILRCLVDLGCEVTVVPSTASSAEILDRNPDGVLISNGPGDPAAIHDGIKTLRHLVENAQESHRQSKRPVALFGICLGHQLLGLALGGQTFKLKFGHHGANHPIKDLETGRVDITTQNHGFAVEGESTAGGDWVIKGNKDVLVTHINLNDNAVEGLRHKTLPIFSVQYHPEAAAGPHDPQHLFNRFMGLMDRRPGSGKA